MKNENLFNSTVNFYNINNENFIEFLSKFYGDILDIKSNDEIHKKLINELFLLDNEFNEKGIDEKILKDKIDLFLENNQIIKKIGKLQSDTEDIKTEIKTETNNISSQLDTKANKTETANIQQQLNNLVLEAVGDGNNAEVIQARGKHTVLNDRLSSNENDLKNFKDNIGTTTVNRGKNLLFLKDQRHETNGLIIDIKDQLITISGQVQDTGFHNYIVLDVDTPDVLDGDYSVYSIVTDEQ